MFRKTEANGQVVQDRQLGTREKIETTLCKLEELKNDVSELRCLCEGLKKLCLEDKGNTLVYNECGIAYARMTPHRARMDSKPCHTLLREDNEHKGHKYLCSNPNCKKVFSRPKIIKYQVCPTCQTLVNMAEAEKQGEKSISFAPKKSVELKKQKKVETDKTRALEKSVRTN